MRRQYWALFVSICFAVACYSLGTQSTSAAVKIIGDFEGDLDSPYAADWVTTAGITVPPEFITGNDPDYHGGITNGEQALVLTTPDRWNGDMFFRLNGDEEMMRDMATYPYLLFDVTTYGGTDTPEEGPVWRQVFNVFNNSETGWFDTNPNSPTHDTDIQRDFPVAGFGEESLTTTVIVDMNGPDPAIDEDEMNFMHLRAQQALADHTDGTPIENLYWQILWVFQGDNLPDTNQIQMVIDNVRFCDTLDCTPSTVLAGDYNQNGNVDAADYVVWRDNLNGGPLPNETVSPGVVDQEDYNEWRAHFGSAALAGGANAVPEPAGVLLALCAAAPLILWRRSAR